MRTAIYPGSFDPITNGHLDVARRAVDLFGKVIIAVANTPRKTHLFAPDERIDLIRRSLPFSGISAPHFSVRVDSFSGLLTDYAREHGPVVVVRGLRAVADFEFEFQFALANKALWMASEPEAGKIELEFAHLMTGEKNLYTSSSLVREIAYFGGDVSQFVTPPVGEALERKYGKRLGKGS